MYLFLFPIGFENFSSSQHSYIFFYLLNFEFTFIMTKIVLFSIILDQSHYHYFKYNNYIQGNINLYWRYENVNVMVIQ